MKTRNTIFFIITCLISSVILLTSCEEKEVETNEEGTLYCSDTTDYKTQIIASNWEVQYDLTNKRVYKSKIDFFDEDFGVIACAGTQDILVTHNGGETWVTKSSPSGRVSSVQVLGVNHFCILANGIYESKDGGNTFSVFEHQNNASGRYSYELYIFDSSHFIASRDRSIAVTRNGGEDWTEHDSLYLSEVQFFGNQLGYAAGGSVSGGVSGGSFSWGYIHKTTNGGDTWRKLNISSDKNIQKLSAFYFTNENTGIVAERTGMLYKTIDGGETWRALTNDLCGYYLLDMIFIDENVGYLASASGIIFKTEDRGVTWQVDYYAGYNVVFYSLTKTPNNTVYVTGDFTMKRTH